jgi:para-nitrobenzyl esterase
MSTEASRAIVICAALLAAACSEKTHEPGNGGDPSQIGPGVGASGASGTGAGTGAEAGGAPGVGGAPRADTDAGREGGDISAGAGDDARPPADAGADASVMRPPPECEEDGSSAPCRACTHQGLVQGMSDRASCEYLGIPYAQPPVGDRRFTAPQPANSWTGVRQATAYGAACIQGMDLSGSSELSEDCLFINIWTPMTSPPEPLPVMVYIYGGGYNGGATNTYAGLDLSEAGPAVVVSMNYRVGALAFFAHPELDRERGVEPSGSDGIRDQQLALRWVKDNIASFHGDPNNVTLFGESAGASSVGIHLVSPGSRGLVQRYILESGVATRGVANGIAPVTRDEMYARTQQMATDLCPSASNVIACLRGLPATELMAWASSGGAGGSGGLGWVPVVEGPGGVLPDTPDALMEAGDFNPGEIIVGTNANEYGLFALLRGSATSVADMRARVEASHPDAVDEIMAIYAPNASVAANQAYVTLMTDVMFRCASRSFARLASANQRSVYLYSFEQGSAWHSDELVYVFGYFSLGVLPPAASLQAAIRGYWLNFAATGDPNGGGLPVWPKYDTASDRHMTLVDPPAAGSGLQKGACDFWDGYLASH